MRAFVPDAVASGLEPDLSAEAPPNVVVDRYTPVGPENRVVLYIWSHYGTEIGTRCRDCTGLKPNEWFDGKWLGRFRRWRYRGEMCSCGQLRATRTLSSVSSGLSWPKSTGTGEARG